ncbi:unnamed protein product [Arctogadus glacialis]
MTLALKAWLNSPEIHQVEPLRRAPAWVVSSRVLDGRRRGGNPVEHATTMEEQGGGVGAQPAGDPGGGGGGPRCWGCGARLMGGGVQWT